MGCGTVYLKREAGRGDTVIAIIDYGAGNLRSVANAFARLGVSTAVTRQPNEIARAAGIILPGVGAFADAMAALEGSGVIPALRAAVADGTPLLGICLGMQMLFDGSEEGPGVQGLGLIPGTVRRMTPSGLKIPHMGWNSLTLCKESLLTAGLPAEPYVYFVHSYACEAADGADVLAVSEYGGLFHAAVQRGPVAGMQFHPEKSGGVGQQILRNFVAMAGKGAGA